MMLAETLNEHCHCVSSDSAKLAAHLQECGLHPGSQPADANTQALFAQYPVFVDPEVVEQIEQLVAAVHEVVHNPRFEERVLAAAPPAARFNQGTRGLLYGFDFHIANGEPRLIEINTNAGGALLCAALAHAQAPCCDAVQPFLQQAATGREVEALLVKGFVDEFKLARSPEAQLRRIAIVDEAPRSQFLYSEFVLFAQLFQAHGIDAQIAAPEELEHRDGALWLHGERVDLVYNRLTDFYLEAESSAALRSAYEANAVVLTPHPRAHALFANKRHLALLSDANLLRELGTAESTIETLTRFVPRSEVVRVEDRERLFRERKQLFFKPLTGYAGKGAYRGDKLTRGKFEEVLAGDYLAQQIVHPSERSLPVDGAAHKLKLDVRAFVVAERVVLLAARLYQGQTTNFRTQGGGFATVLAAPANST
jgi:hypothetical protein